MNEVSVATLILWTVGASGYCVRVLRDGRIVDEYNAGNCRQDSGEVLNPGDPGSLGKEELRACACRTAADISRQYSGAMVEEDPDFSDF